MGIHELKTWPESFEPAWFGHKKAEFRLDDRGYRNGDELRLREWVPGKCVYTGRAITAHVTHVLHGPSFGVPEQFVMLSFDVIRRFKGPNEIF